MDGGVTRAMSTHLLDSVMKSRNVSFQVSKNFTSPDVFLGQSFSGLKRDFMDIRQRFRGRYVRIYGACDKRGF